MSYLEAVRYLEDLVNYEKLSLYPYQEALNLERFRGFLDSINNPQRLLKCIHVAGTKGKGSTCAFLTYILREAGFKTGLYTSPHLIDFRERIRILAPRGPSLRGAQAASHCEPRSGEAISESGIASGASRLRNDKLGFAMTNDFEGLIAKPKLASLVEKLKPAIEKYNRSSQYGQLTFFEACTALALVYFQEKKVDFAVLETGLGGKLDATNVVAPLVSVITPVSYEHMDKLGRTLKKIAAEKAGIIKPDSIVISAPQEKAALDVMRNKCKKEGAKLLIVGKDIKYKNLKIRLIGEHQLVNANVALAAVNALAESGIKVSIDSIRKGLYNTLWPGRLEVVAKKPLIVLDGAQNKASAGVLKKAVQERFRYKRLILVLGVSDDKDIQGIARELEDLAGIVILTKSRNPRAAGPNALRRFFRGKETHVTPSVKEAKALALRLADKRDLILVTGSLFVVGEFRDAKA